MIVFFCLHVTNAQSQSDHLFSLISSERAFAAATKLLGVRNGFLIFFADDAVALDSSFGRYKDGLLKRPQPPMPLKTQLLWAPTSGDVSSAGDLGYLTGPSRVVATGTTGSDLYAGWYFSVWRRQADGTWKVYLDVGTETPDRTLLIDTVGFTPAPTANFQKADGLAGTLAGLRTADGGLNSDIGQGKLSSLPLAPSVRFHRNGSFPLIGRDSCITLLTNGPRLVALTRNAGMSSTGDLGYSYGSVSISGAPGRYVRAWKWIDSRWTLVADVTVQDGR